jgi:PAS domain S-box-containing protein
MLFGSSPIQRRLMAMLLLTSGTVLLLTCTAFAAYEYLTFRRTTLQQLSTVGEIIASNSTAALAFQNPDDAAEILAALAAEPHIVAAALYTDAGALFCSYPLSMKTTEFPAAPGEDGLRFESAAAIGFLPVIQEGNRRLGTFYLKSDLGALNERLRRYLLIALLVIAISLLVAVALSSVLQRQISHPILALTDATRAISEHHDYSVRVERRGEDELGRLTDAFNQMLARIEEQNRALQESEADFRNVAETMPQIVWTADAQGRLDYHNQRWHDYAGTGVGLSGRSILHPDDYRRCLELWRSSVATGNRYEIEYRLRRAADGAYRWHIGRASPLRNADSQIARWIGTCTDIEDLKYAEARLLQTLADLRDRNRDLQDFAFVASHDLQEPLRKIQIYSDRLLSEAAATLQPQHLSLLDRTQKAAARLQMLIQDLLAYTSIHSAQQGFAPADLGKVASEVIVDLEASIDACQARLIVGALPTLHCDVLQMRRLFQNIIANALKFRDAQRQPVIQITAQPVQLDPATPGWEIRVADNGIGMEQSYTESIFTLFKRLHPHERYEGTGIGLSIVRRIVERHRGSVRAVSTPSVGTTFIIVLPQWPSASVDVPETLSTS